MLEHSPNNIFFSIVIQQSPETRQFLYRGDFIQYLRTSWINSIGMVAGGEWHLVLKAVQLPLQ